MPYWYQFLFNVNCALRTCNCFQHQYHGKWCVLQLIWILCNSDIHFIVRRRSFFLSFPLNSVGRYMTFSHCARFRNRQRSGTNYYHFANHSILHKFIHISYAISLSFSVALLIYAFFHICFSQQNKSHAFIGKYSLHSIVVMRSASVIRNYSICLRFFSLPFAFYLFC